MKIFVDYRERPSGIILELAKHKIEAEEKALPIGDFMIQTKDHDNNLITLCIEKKTQEDFLSSIIDKRLLRQLIDMKEVYNNQLLIIEGSRNLYALRKFHPNSIRGMLATIAIDLQIPIITTRTVADTASFLALVAKRSEKNRKELDLTRKRKPASIKEHQEFIIESFPSIGPILAKSMLEEFKTIKNIVNSTEEKLKKIEKIGEKKAKDIIEIINKKYE